MLYYDNSINTKVIDNKRNINKNDPNSIIHTQEQMQMKIINVAAASASVVLNTHKGKNKIPKYNAENTNPVTLDEKSLNDVESFPYIRSIIDEQGGSHVDVKAKAGKAMAAFLQLDNRWNSKEGPKKPTDLGIRNRPEKNE